MPYTTQSVYTAVSATFTSTDQYGSSSHTWNLGEYPKRGVLHFDRSGTNAPSMRQAGLVPKAPQLFKRVFVSVPKGPRLAFKVKNRFGKLVWARQRIMVEKLIKVRRPRLPGPSKGMNLAPNKLDFRSWKLEAFPATVTLKSALYPFETDVATGDLWVGVCPFTLRSMIDTNSFLSTTTFGVAAGLVSELDERALQNFHSAIKDQSVNIAQMLAERSQTVKLLTDATLRLVGALRALKSGDVGKVLKNLFPAAEHVGKKTAKQLSSDFLATQYGIRPLISDINGVIDELNKGEEIFLDVKKGKTSEQTTYPYTDQIFDTGMLRGRCTVSVQAKAAVHYKARFKCEGRVMGLSRLLARTGFSNPLQLGWELIPFSFVIDWFLPIGKALANLDSTVGLTTLWATKTTFMKEVVTVSRTFKGVSGYGFFPTSNVVDAFKFTRVSCTRQILTNIPSPPIPNFKNPFSPEHIANALALLRQLKR